MTAGFLAPDHWTEVSGLLRRSGSCVLDSTGNGVVFFETSSSNQRWVVTQVVVNTNQNATATLVPQCFAALNTTSFSTMSQSNQFGGTWSGNQDTFSTSFDVSPMDFLSILFTPPPGTASVAALVGVQCNVVILGTTYTRRR